jgi:glutamyl-tRNA synthetase
VLSKGVFAVDTVGKAIRVRFAPSPTGYLHIGSARTALFNVLFARANKGTFILRIEDTDRSRYVEGSFEDIKESLSWLGLQWDEGPGAEGAFGPYIQSQRLDIYREHVNRLVETGHAYYCFCTPERLEALRQSQASTSDFTGYDRKCRHLPKAEVDRLLSEGVPAVVRFKIPEEGATVFEDALRGEIRFENKVLDDFVLMKSDGYPTYQLASVVDDHLMQISHVIRGDEWINSAPKHVLLYRAFGWEAPVLAHLPVVLSQSGGKLSKRDGATQLREFRDKGYLPEALVNFLALLGWTSPDEQEVFDFSEMTSLFSLDRVGTSPAVFSYEKLDWLNGVHIRRLSPEEFGNRCIPFLQRDGLISMPPTDFEMDMVRKIAPLLQERVKLLSEISDAASYFFRDDIAYDPSLLVQKKMTIAETKSVLERALALLESIDDFSETSLDTSLRALAESLGLKAGQVLMPIRVAVSGRTATPGLFETLSVIGKERVLDRMRRAVSALGE